jgi:hypothetical protein
MLTLFAIPKPFEGHSAIIQRNAVESWKKLPLNCEIILCGDDRGVKETAMEFDTKFLLDISRNEYGTPLVSSAFEQMERFASHRLLCYVNADIILLGNFVSAVKSIPLQKFLMVGQRWDLNITEPLNFEAVEWEQELRKRIAGNGAIHPPTGIDYFVFPKGTMGKLPPFAVGRPGWDNWLILRARALGIPVIDATRVATVVHQNHDYSHVKQATDNFWEGPEAQRNRELADGWRYIFTIRDSTHLLVPDKSTSSGSSFSLRRNLRTLPLPALKVRKKLGDVAAAGVRFLKRRFPTKP